MKRGQIIAELTRSATLKAIGLVSWVSTSGV